MRFLVSLFLTSLLMGCTTVRHQHVTVEQYHYNYIDSAFHPMIKSFIYEAEWRGHKVDMTNVSMTFGNIRTKKSDKTVGYCARNPIGGMVIKIHTPTWSQLGPYQQEELIFHEMAHCLLAREHCSKKNKVGPISIMYPEILQEGYIREFREELIDELFNISSECVRDDGDANAINGPICPQKNHNKPR